MLDKPSLYHRIFSYFTLDEQIKKCLPLSKKVSKYISENSGEQEGKWTNNRRKKLVLHFNERFKEVIESKKIPLTTLDMMVQLTDIVIIEIDELTFKGETSFL